MTEYGKKWAYDAHINYIFSEVSEEEVKQYLGQLKNCLSKVEELTSTFEAKSETWQKIYKSAFEEEICSILFDVIHDYNVMVIKNVEGSYVSLPGGTKLRKLQLWLKEFFEQITESRYSQYLLEVI